MNQKAKTILRPLFIWAFIQALVFWYAIEKLLWSSSGITVTQIIVLGLFAQSGQIIFDIPSSIIADRWSRRKTLILSSVFMLITTMIALFVQNFLAFAIMSVTWGLFFSFQSGTINAYIYDLLKEQGEQSQYRKAISRHTSFELLGLLISSLGASLLVWWGNLLTPFWVTTIPLTISIIILVRMREPAIERTEHTTGTIVHHLRSAVANFRYKQWLWLIFAALAFVTAGRFVWYEYYQLYALERYVAPVLFGIVLACIHVGNLLGSELAHRVKSPGRVIAISLTALMLSTTLLIISTNSWVITLLLLGSFFGSQALTIVFDESLQHQTASELRATTLSLVGFTSRIIFALCAGGIIILGTTPEAIAVATLAVFVVILIYLPVRKHLVAATANPSGPHLQLERLKP